MNQIFEKQSNIYNKFKSSILEKEAQKKEDFDRNIASQQRQEQEKQEKIYNEAMSLKNESKKMHQKILQLQILDKQKKLSIIKKFE